MYFPQLEVKINLAVPMVLFVGVNFRKTIKNTNMGCDTSYGQILILHFVTQGDETCPLIGQVHACCLSRVRGNGLDHMGTL